MKVILTEKPSVGRDLARVLKATKKCDGYFEGNGYAVTWAYGHLVELCEPQEYDLSYKSWSLNSLPIIPEKFQLKVSSNKGVKEQFNVIKKLFKLADSIICATDSGREGELIFRYIQQLCKAEKKTTFRLWLNSLTDTAILEGFDKLKPLSAYDHLAAAARCRSEADWIIGMNATRGYTVKFSRGRGVFSLGRVQTPVLALIVHRDQEIRNFKPEDYFELWTLYKNVKFKHVKDRFKKKSDIEPILSKIVEAPFEILKLEEKNLNVQPPFLFDLTELQRTLNKSCGFTATHTLALCQSLYEKKLISYPRTDSRFLTDDLFPECKKILSKLQQLFPSELQNLSIQDLPKSKRVFNNSNVKDHHAIIPTGLFPSNLSREEGVVYRTIALRLIASFYPVCKKLQTIVHGKSLDEKFVAKGTQIVQLGWLFLYQTEAKEKGNDEEQLLPSFKEGEKGPHKPEIKSCKTKPPLHYTEGTLLTAMETAGKIIDNEELKEAMKEKGLGTPATRASIIETLIKRDYIYKEGKKILSSIKGQELISLLPQNGILSSPEMTAEWEFKLNQVAFGSLDSKDFMQGVTDLAQNIVQILRQEKPVDLNNLGSCPFCKAPVIKGNTGYGCSAWKTGCQFRFLAKQFGVTLTDEQAHTLLHEKRLSRPRTLTFEDGSSVKGYLMLEDGKVGYQTISDKEAESAIATCPSCKGSILDKYKSYNCSDCELTIWKKIASRDISKSLVSVLVNKGKTQKLNGFRSKAGKSFSAALKLENNKVVFEFCD